MRITDWPDIVQLVTDWQAYDILPDMDRDWEWSSHEDFNLAMKHSNAMCWDLFSGKL